MNLERRVILKALKELSCLLWESKVPLSFRFGMHFISTRHKDTFHHFSLKSIYAQQLILGKERDTLFQTLFFTV